MIQPPDGIIITISQAMIKEKGYRNWLRNFLNCMGRVTCMYSMRLDSKPKHDLLYVYLCIGGKVRYRATFVGTSGPAQRKFDDGMTMYAKAWVHLIGPVVRPLITVKMKGFRGFRYTERLF